MAGLLRFLTCQDKRKPLAPVPLGTGHLSELRMPGRATDLLSHSWLYFLFLYVSEERAGGSVRLKDIHLIITHILELVAGEGIESELEYLMGCAPTLFWGSPSACLGLGLGEVCSFSWALAWMPTSSRSLSNLSPLTAEASPGKVYHLTSLLFSCGPHPSVCQAASDGEGRVRWPLVKREIRVMW